MSLRTLNFTQCPTQLYNEISKFRFKLDSVFKNFRKSLNLEVQGYFRSKEGNLRFQNCIFKSNLSPKKYSKAEKREFEKGTFALTYGAHSNLMLIADIAFFKSSGSSSYGQNFDILEQMFENIK